jgi:DNA repair protein RecO (recombination protein O)
MPLSTTTAICLRKVDFSETSQILTLLTEKHGIVGAIAKGAKREKSSVGGPLDLMCLYNVALYDRSRRGTLSILAQAELLDFFPASRRDFARFMAIETIRELLLAIEAGPEDAPSLMLLAVKAIRGLATAEPPRVLLRFAWELLHAMGVEPVVTHCVVTGAEPSGKVAVQFSLREMGLIAPPHDEGRKDLVRIEPAALNALLAIARGEAIDGIAVDACHAAFTLLAWLVATQGGRRLRTVLPLVQA